MVHDAESSSVADCRRIPSSSHSRLQADFSFLAVGRSLVTSGEVQMYPKMTMRATLKKTIRGKRRTAVTVTVILCNDTLVLAKEPGKGRAPGLVAIAPPVSRR